MEINEDHSQLQKKQKMFIPASPFLLTNILKSLELEDKGVLPQVSLEQLAQTLQDKEWKIRLSAVRTLRSWNEDEEVDKLLEKASEDENEFVCITAVHALEYRQCRYSKEETQIDNKANPFSDDPPGAVDPPTTVEEVSLLPFRKKIVHIDNRHLINIFCCFFPKDFSLIRELKECLSTYEWQDLKIIWHEHKVEGMQFQENISLSPSQINVFLISPDFIASRYWWNRMNGILENYEGKDICIIPISPHPTHEEYIPFNRFQAIHIDEKLVYAPSMHPNNEILTRVIERISHIIDNTTRNYIQASPNVLWHVPFERNPFFTGREKLLEQLHTALISSKSAALTQSAAISGLGGIGKTQMAIEYVYRYSREYSSVLWFNADTYESLLTDLVKLSSFLDISSREAEDDYLIESIKAWLAHQEKWLLIFDNADNLKITTGIISHIINTKGHVLFTTRTHPYDPTIQSIKVEKMDQEESLSLLLRRGGTFEQERDQAIVRDIATELDGLPLALDQAGAYISETHSSWSEYLNLYRAQRREIGRKQGIYELYPTSSSLNAAATFSLAFQKVGRIDHTAIELLQLCAFLYPDAIPEEIIKEGIQLQYGVLPTTDIDKVIELVQRYALILYNKETKTLQIHRIIQTLIKKMMIMRTQKEWATQAIWAINAMCFTSETSGMSYQSERCLSQALSGIHLIDKYNLAIPEAIGILIWTGSCLDLEDFYRQAEHVLYWPWINYKEKKIKEDSSSMSAIYRLIKIYEKQRNPKQAELLYHYATHTSEANHRFEHSNIPIIINKFIEVFEKKSAEAQVDLILHYKLGRKKTNKRENLDIALLLQKLIILYAAQEKHLQSEETYQKALIIWKQTLGLTPLELMSTFSDLALLYFNQNKYQEMETLLLYVLIAGKNFSHPSNTASTMVENANKLLQYIGHKQKGINFKSEILMMTNYQAYTGQEHKDFFISYTDKDSQWAQWIAFELEAAGYHTIIQAWDIRPGSNFVAEMDEAATRALRTILVLSEAYLASDYAFAEWAAAFRRDPKGKQGKVLPVRIERCTIEGLLGPIGYIDLVDLDEQHAREQLLAGVQRGRAKPATIPFPASAAPSGPLVDRPVFPGSLPPIWNIPYPQNPLFIGREELLTQLATTWHTGQPAALSQPQAMSGLGGIGKTQLALEYAYRYRQDYQAALWAQADTRDNLTSSYLAIAALLDLPEKSEQESIRIITAVKNWLQHTMSWLLILDNADDLALARDFLPPSFGGHVLLTTRAQATGRFAHHLEIDILPTEQGALFLLRRAGLLSPDAILEQASDTDGNIARAICEELGGLPLALDQAGAYIEETGCRLATYQHLYQSRRADLLAERRRQLVDDHPLPVATTWSLSFAQVEQKNPAAADLLRLCAFLAPDAIPEEIITEGAEYLGSNLASVAADPYLLNQALEVLRAYSLVCREASSETAALLSVHRLVQAVILDQMDKQSRRQWAERTVYIINATLPLVEHESWPQWEQLLAHALVCCKVIEHQGFRFAEATELLHLTGWYLAERARYQEAEHFLKQALFISEQKHRREHVETARDSATLANLYRAQGKYTLAEPLYQRALSICEKQLGQEHPLTASNLNNLALLYDNQGNYALAEPLYQRALAIREQQLDQMHPDMAGSLNNLAELYRAQGKYEQAEPLLKRALAIYEQQLGVSHPNTAVSLNNLAALYDDQMLYSNTSNSRKSETHSQMMKPKPVTVFLSYAHEDESLRSELEKHLSLLQRQGLISTWHDRCIMAGTDWAQEIDEHLKSASIILLLVSADFLASDYCYGVEMQCALDRDKADQARVIPIMVRPCDKKGAPFAHLQALPTDARAITTWNNRDEAWTDVAAGIRRVIEELPPPSVKTPSAGLPPVWNVPYPQNPLFTGREELLTQLVSTLHTGQPTALSQPQAISGLGGNGKTQLALEYAYQYRQEYQAVLWAQADTRENLTSSYLTIATLLNLPEQGEQESAWVIAAVKNWLQRNTGWLLILDNADDLVLACDFLPPSLEGHILLTTRAQATGRFAHRLEIDILPTEQSVLFLLRRAGLLPADATLEQASKHDRDRACTICEELGGLPLALDQAGAYIEETQCNLSDYQRLYQHHRANLLAERRRQLVDDHPLPVATTLSLSFAQVEQNNPAAADLLRLCALLAPDAIPEEIVTQGAKHLGPNLAPVGADTYLLNQAVEALRAYSLLSRDPHAHMLSVHRLVQAVLKDQMDEQDRKLWAQRATRAVNATFPEVEHQTWPQCTRLLPHALLCAELIAQEQMNTPEAARLLNQTGYYLKERARYMEAEPLYQRALLIREQELGATHPTTAQSLNNLAGLYLARGEYEQAEPLYQRAFSIREQQLGPQHPDTASSLNNLATLYQAQGKYAEAEPLYQRALAIVEQELGANHPGTASSLNNLAALYHMQGKYAEAEPLYQRALVIFDDILGREHPETQIASKNYANLLRTIQRTVEAKELDEGL